MSPNAAANLMKFVGLVSLGFGLLIAAGAYPPFAGPLQLFYDMLDWPVDGVADLSTSETRLLAAISGGIFSGLAMVFILIFAPAIKRGDKEICRGAMIAILTWFIVDSTGSVAAGVAMNVLPNIFYLAFMLAPLVLADPKTSLAEPAGE